VQPAAAFYKLPSEAITAFHDELDLVPGKLRVKFDGGAAGHNGLRSMDRQLGTADYWRVRLGLAIRVQRTGSCPMYWGFLQGRCGLADSVPGRRRGRVPVARVREGARLHVASGTADTARAVSVARRSPAETLSFASVVMPVPGPQHQDKASEAKTFLRTSSLAPERHPRAPERHPRARPEDRPAQTPSPMFEFPGASRDPRPSPRMTIHNPNDDATGASRPRVN